jgi:hypothetical protein
MHGNSFFINHLHQYFGYLLHCSAFGSTFDRYNGSTNMYHIHKYMGYTNAQEQYTNEQFYLSAKSLGFAEKDARKIWGMLTHLFSQRCEPPKPIPHWAKPAPQSICTNVSQKGRERGRELTKRYRKIVLYRSMLRVSCMIRSIHRCLSPHKRR